MKLNEQMNK